jgi:xanthine phosphoribosyltransferase
VERKLKMELLKEKILMEGKVKSSSILKVDNFLNHQIDISFMKEVGKEFRKRFQDREVNKILTIEASGIAIASITAQYFDNVKVVFGKKIEGLNMDSEVYESAAHSFTKNKTYNVVVSKNYLNSGDKVLILDDFLANGCAATALIEIVRQAGAEVVGLGVVIEKGFQLGRREIEKLGVKVEALATIESMGDNKICFR